MAEPAADAAAVSTLVEQLRSACRGRGTWVSADDYVRECDAADLLGMRAKTLVNRRANGSALPHIKRAARPLYSLATIAEWIIANSFPQLP